MTPSLRAALALAILMIRDRMTYRFAGFGAAVSLVVGLILLYLTTLSIQPTEAHIGIDSQADLALFLISGGIMTSTLGIYSSQAATWIGSRRSSGMLEAIMASGVSLHHLSYAVILWPALLQFAKVGLTHSRRGFSAYSQASRPPRLLAALEPPLSPFGLGLRV